MQSGLHGWTEIALDALATVAASCRSRPCRRAFTLLITIGVVLWRSVSFVINSGLVSIVEPPGVVEIGVFIARRLRFSVGSH